jgi:hypothetical protein
MKAVHVFSFVLALVVAYILIDLLIGGSPSDYGVTNLDRDTLRTYRTKEGLWVAERKALVADAASLRAALSDSSESSRRLRSALRSSMIQASYFKSLTSGSSSGATTVSTGTSDTIISHDTTYILRYPVYRYSSADKWAQFDIAASRDTTRLTYLITNSYVHELGRSGTFWRPSVSVRVTNLNPNTRTTELTAVSVPEPSRLAFGPYLGLGLNASGQLVPTVGLGIHYDLIRFRGKR